MVLRLVEAPAPIECRDRFHGGWIVLNLIVEDPLRILHKAPTGSSTILTASARTRRSYRRESARRARCSTGSPSGSRASAGTCCRWKKARLPATGCAETESPSRRRSASACLHRRVRAPAPSTGQAGERRSRRRYRATPLPRARVSRFNFNWQAASETAKPLRGSRHRGPARAPMPGIAPTPPRSGRRCSRHPPGCAAQ